MTRPDFIRYGNGRAPMVVVKCPDCGWLPIPAAAFDRLPKATDCEAVQCRCGIWVPYQEAAR